MADKFKTETSVQGGRHVISGYKGSEAGKDSYYEEQERKRRQQDWLNKKGWGGIGGAAKRPRDWEKKFDEEDKTRAAKSTKPKG